MIQINHNARDVLRQLREFPDQMVKGLCRTIDKQNRLTISHVARTRLSFPRNSTPGMAGLRVQTGNLRRGLVAGLVPARQVGNAVIGSITNNVKYAAVHEFGYTFPAKGMIYPKNAKALRFMVGGKVVFRAWVNQTRPITIPARAPVRHGLDERAQDYSDAFSETIMRTFKQSL